MMISRVQRASHRSRLRHYLLVALLIFLTCLWFVPVLFIFLDMFKDNAQIMMNPWALPRTIKFDTFIGAWKTGMFATYYLNSIYVTSISIILNIVLSAMAAYAFARMRFRLRQTLFSYIIAGMMVSIYTIIIPLYLGLKDVGLINMPREALILVYAGTAIPFSVYFLTMFFRTIPAELEEAARMDGCTRFGILTKIIIPLAKPALAALTIFLFAGFWNEFYLALIFISKMSLRTVPLGLMYFADQYSTDYGGQISAVIIASVPIVLIYFLLQRQFIQGITAGALKG